MALYHPLAGPKPLMRQTHRGDAGQQQGGRTYNIPLHLCLTSGRVSCRHTCKLHRAGAAVQRIQVHRRPRRVRLPPGAPEADADRGLKYPTCIPLIGQLASRGADGSRCCTRLLLLLLSLLLLVTSAQAVTMQVSCHILLLCCAAF